MPTRRESLISQALRLKHCQLGSLSLSAVRWPHEACLPAGRESLHVSLWRLFRPSEIHGAIATAIAEAWIAPWLLALHLRGAPSTRKGRSSDDGSRSLDTQVNKVMIPRLVSDSKIHHEGNNATSSPPTVLTNTNAALHPLLPSGRAARDSYLPPQLPHGVSRMGPSLLWMNPGDPMYIWIDIPPLRVASENTACHGFLHWFLSI